MFTRKHYKQVAQIIRESGYNSVCNADDEIQDQLKENIAGNFADMFEQDNENFDRQQFMEACGFTE